MAGPAVLGPGLDDAYIINKLGDLHADDPEFGYRFLTDELHTSGHRAGDRRVWRLCSQKRLWSVTVKEGLDRWVYRSRTER